jgi:hypothetical protein
MYFHLASVATRVGSNMTSNPGSNMTGSCMWWLFLLRRVKESVETSRSHIKINNTIISLIFFVGEFASFPSGCVAAWTLSVLIEFRFETLSYLGLPYPVNLFALLTVVVLINFFAWIVITASSEKKWFTRASYIPSKLRQLRIFFTIYAGGNTVHT